jgi:hypothetical protein
MINVGRPTSKAIDPKTGKIFCGVGHKDIWDLNSKLWGWSQGTVGLVTRNCGVGHKFSYC